MDGQHGERREFDPSRFFESFVWVSRTLVLQPRLFFRNLPTHAGLRQPLLFLVTTSFLAALFIANYHGVGFQMFLSLMAANIFSALIAGLVLHAIALKLSRTSAPLAATLRVICYASVVDIAAWIPIIGVVPYGYGLYLIFVGMQEVHTLSPRQAGFALMAIILVITVLVSTLVMLSPESIQEGLKLLDPQQS